LPFTLLDTDIKDMLSDEEESVSILSASNRLGGVTQPIDIINNNNNLVPAIMVSVSRHPSHNRNSERNSIGQDSILRGSFYGRRDFENKHDDTADIGVGSVNNNKLCRKPSTLDNVLTRIKSMRNSDHSDDESENDDDDDYEQYYDDDDGPENY
jgi:hypothetical protein